MIAVGSRSSDDLAVEVAPAGDVAQLEAEWRRLEACGDVSFFQSWDWIGSLLESVPAAQRPLVLRVRSADATLALALLGHSVEQRYQLIRARTLHLNETGDAELDGLAIEHNGLVVAPGEGPRAAAAVLRALEARNDWDELRLGGLTSQCHAYWDAAARGSRLVALNRWEKDYYYIDLAKVRQTANYLAGLSANTRHQIRRAMKLYGERGPLELRRASDLDEARVWLDALVKVHQQYWRAQGLPGAFGSAFALRFHAALLQRAWPHGAVEVVRVTAGAQPVGYLYNFRKAGVLYNYQSGIAYEADARLKPGLICHALVAEDASARGLDRYDLLMGGGHYKRRLANGAGRMVWYAVQKRRLILRVENALRRASARWRPATQSALGEDSPTTQSASPY